MEKKAAGNGKQVVDIETVKTARKQFFSRMASEIKGYRLDSCFGHGDCPNRAVVSDHLVKRLDQLLQAADLLSFLKNQVGDDLKFHHEFRVTIADCPNACSQPQIKDVGIIGAVLPTIAEEVCTHCGACVDVCPDHALSLDERVVISPERCMACGKCILACPSGTLREKIKGYRVLLGGKLGKHPRLARELPGIFDEQDVVHIVEVCVAFYKEKSRRGKRFAEILTEADFDDLARRFSNQGGWLASQ